MFQVYTGVKFISLNEPEDDMGWHAKLQANNNEIDHAAEDPNILVKNDDKLTFSMDFPLSVTCLYCQLSIYLDFPA